MKRFRRNAVYAPDAVCFEPIDRNQRILVMMAAEELERRTKAKGQKSGVLGQSGLVILRHLLFTFCSVPSGCCCPSYEAIRKATGYCTSTIADALSRLEASGLVRITRRIVRTPAGARQTTNAYAFSDCARGEKKPDFENSRETTNLFKKKGMQATGTGLYPVQLSFTLQRVLASLDQSRGGRNRRISIDMKSNSSFASGIS